MTISPTYTFPNLSVEKPQPATLLVRLNRPDRLNALTFGMFNELHEVCRRAEADPDIRAVVVTGNGRAFCAGMDLGDAAKLAGMSAVEFTRRQEQWAAAITSFARSNLVVVAAVNGPSCGAGFSLALAADIRIASPTAKFNAAFIRIGLTGGDCGSSWLLPRVVGMGHASEMLLTGRLVGAEEASRIGLVNKVVADDDLVAESLEVVGQVLANAPMGVRLTKQALLVNGTEPSLDAAVELENRNQVLTALTQDHQEGLRAFLEHRAPRYEDH